MENSDSAVTPPTVWHLSWQAAIGRDLLSSSKLIEKITDRLMQSHRRKDRVLLYYLVTSREIHVLSTISAADSPRAVVREVATIVARWVRELQGVRGPVFAERYHAHGISTDEELKFEIRMLAWRPVVTGHCSKPISYVHSSLRMTLGQRRAYGFESRPLLSVFDGSVLEARRGIRLLLRRRPTQPGVREWELNHGLAIAAGTAGASFGLAREVEGPAAALVAASPTQDIDGALQLLGQWVALRLGLTHGEGIARIPGPVGGRARALVAGIAVQVKLCPAAAVARHFDRARATLCEQMSASRQRTEDRELLRMPIQLILDDLKKMSKRRVE